MPKFTITTDNSDGEHSDDHIEFPNSKAATGVIQGNAARQSRGHQVTPLSLVIFLVVSASAAALAAPWFSAPSFDEIMHGCMVSEASEPPAQRAATCLCHFDEMQSWTVNARLLMAGAGSREVTRRASLNQCRASAARLH